MEKIKNIKIFHLFKIAIIAFILEAISVQLDNYLSQNFGTTVISIKNQCEQIYCGIYIKFCYEVAC